ncbi:MAG: hypothetical protein JXB38_14290, partial [Anaerolineales bacterium]|nr:hypothetical protein [Anaerolineales bacterium]
QLCANGVDGWKIRHETGWGVHWGPVRAADIPAYLAAKRKKTDAMRDVHFGLKERLEMATISIFFYGVMLLIPFLIFWRPHLWLLLGLTVLFSYLFATLMPWLPGKDGIGKGAALGVLTILGVLVWSLVWGKLPLDDLYSWSLGLGFLAFFLGSEFQGMTPVLRGPAGNWPLEGVVGLGTLALYGIGRLF